MAIKTSSGSGAVETVTNTYIYQVSVGTFSQKPLNGPSGAKEYVGTYTVNYGCTVTAVSIKTCTLLGYTPTGYTISSDKQSVTYKFYSNKSGASGSLTVNVTLQVPVTGTNITDVRTAGGTYINYVKRSSGTCFWTRPTSFSLALPWTAVQYWQVDRIAALNPQASDDVTLASGTSTSANQTITGVYYGDTLKITATPKTGATLGMGSSQQITIDPNFSYTNTNYSSKTLAVPTLTITRNTSDNVVMLKVYNPNDCYCNVYLKGGWSQYNNGTTTSTYHYNNSGNSGIVYETSYVKMGTTVAAKSTSTYNFTVGNKGYKSGSDWACNYIGFYVYLTRGSTSNNFYIDQTADNYTWQSSGTLVTGGGGGEPGGGPVGS